MLGLCFFILLRCQTASGTCRRETRHILAEHTADFHGMSWRARAVERTVHIFATPWQWWHHRQILTCIKARELKPGPCARHPGQWKLPNDHAKVSIIILLWQKGRRVSPRANNLPGATHLSSRANLRLWSEGSMNEQMAAGMGSFAMPVLYHCLVPCPSLGCMGDSRELKPSEGMVLRVCPSPILSLSNHWQTEPQAGMLVQGLWMSAGFINAFCGSKMVNTLAAAFHPTAWKKKEEFNFFLCFANAQYVVWVISGLASKKPPGAVRSSLIMNCRGHHKINT